MRRGGAARPCAGARPRALHARDLHQPGPCPHGYHYPRSYSTAIKSAHYFERFCNDYGFCLHTEFDQVYATSAHFSWTNAAEFRRFCAAAGIRCDDVAPERYFNPGLCDGAFLTTEYTYDAQILKRWFLEQLAALPNVEVLYSHKPTAIEKVGSAWRVQAGDITAETPYLLNTTYAGVNDVHAMLGLPPFGIKYENARSFCVLLTKNFVTPALRSWTDHFSA